MVYLVFLLILGLPVLIAEFSVGRASGKSVARAFHELEPAGTKWHWYGPFAIAGNYLLMMFYSVVAGWMLSYCVSMTKGDFVGLSSDAVTQHFLDLLASPGKLIFWMLAICIFGFASCAIGLQKGVERITKIMMSALIIIMLGLAIYVMTIPGSGAGYSFYLKPNFKALIVNGSPWEAIYAAMGQAFFTLSLGIGSMEIFGSYIDKKHSLPGEALRVIGLDTFVAICSGLIVFPACLAFKVEPGAGPGLVMMSLPNVFNSMGAVSGRIFGSLFFLFMSFAAISTVIAVFENIVAYHMDSKGWSRRKSVAVNFVALILLSVPAALGMNIWSNVKILGLSIDGVEDFIVSQNLLPLGSLIFLLFCCSKKGWGWKNFIAEADSGIGVKMMTGKLVRFYLTYVVPLIILVIFVAGYISTFGHK